MILQKKKMSSLYIIIAIIIAFSAYVLISKNININKDQKQNTQPIKIGIITATTGTMAYWGESSVIGARMAIDELKKEGINNLELLIEDGALDSKIALSAAQKLINIDKADTIYTDFTPSAISVSSFLKDKEIIHIYSSAAMSPLSENLNTYKTFLDYEEGCKKTAQFLKDTGIEKVGVLKINLENGEMCLRGVKNIFGDNIIVEGYNQGTTDFRSSLLKLKTNNIGALFSIGFKSDALSSLKQFKELGLSSIFVGAAANFSHVDENEYLEKLEGSIMFDLPAASNDFIEKVQQENSGKQIGNYQAVALTYIHIKQLGRALSLCNKETKCTKRELDKSKEEPLVGFTGFKDRKAIFNIFIQEWKNGAFVPAR